MRACLVAFVLLSAAGETSRAAGPLRRVLLVGGDSVFGELVSIDDRRVVFRSRFGTRHEVPRSQCVGVAQPDGVIDLDLREPSGDGWKTGQSDLSWKKDAERDPVVDASPPFAMKAVMPDAAVARMAFGWQAPVDERGRAMPVRLVLELLFRGEAASTDLSITVPIGESPPVRVRGGSPAPASFDITPRPVRAGWRDVVLLIHAGRLRVLVDGQVCVSGDAPRESLQQIALRTERTGSDVRESPVARISQPLLQRIESTDAGERPDFVRRDPEVDTAWLASGDEIPGRVAAMDHAGVELIAGDRTTSIPWSDLRGVAFAARSEATAAVTGTRARIELVPPGNQIPQTAEVLTGAIVAESRDSVSLSHPVLGRIDLPASQVRHVRRFGRGVFQVLDGAVHHLGDEVRSAFHRPRPEGTSLEGRFASQQIPAASRGWLCFEVRDVEPCGPDAPKGTPFLSELRAGFLRTEVTLNGSPLGDLNSHLTYKAAPAGSQRVRVPFRTDLLKAGDNVWRLKQQPARTDESSFDDCEIGPVTLEIDLPEASAGRVPRTTEASP